MADAVPVTAKIPSEPPKAVDKADLKGLNPDLIEEAKAAMAAGKRVFVLATGGLRIDH